ncbi:hypothetical protein HDU97_004631 [Phlyctochytrium planicorne]|nr:hypothetical protein HDU97_004631 [Phlyctochytrium planicorne]
MDEISLLYSSALKRLNALLKLHKIKPVPTDILKNMQQVAGGMGKKKWWVLFKKDVKDPKESSEQLVLKTALCKSIDYASIPCEPDDSFNLRRVPILVYECCKYIRTNGLKTNGIFRVNGSEKRIQQLGEVFDAGPRYGHGFNFEGYTIYDVADLLKKFVRTLPDPLLTSELYPYFLKCLDIPVENGARCKAFRWLCMLLPPPHLILFEYLLELFVLVANHAGDNQMTATNLARIFSPNLLRPKLEKQALEEFQSCAIVLEFFIENHSEFRISARDIKPFEILDVAYLPARKPSVKRKHLVYRDDEGVGSNRQPSDKDINRESVSSQPMREDLPPQAL